MSSKQSKKVTIIAEPVKSKSKTRDDKIQELPSDSEDNSDEDEYNDSFTQSKKTEKTEKTYNTYSNEFESKRHTARSHKSNTIKTNSE